MAFFLRFWSVLGGDFPGGNAGGNNLLVHREYSRFLFGWSFIFYLVVGYSRFVGVSLGHCAGGFYWRGAGDVIMVSYLGSAERCRLNFGSLSEGG